MPRFTEQDGVIFCESHLDGQVVGDITVKGATQNTLLTELKRDMANQARTMGGNAIMNFNYGQRADRGANIFKWDTERLYGSGTVVRLSERPSED